MIRFNFLFLVTGLLLFGCEHVTTKKTNKGKVKDGVVEQFRADGSLKTSVALKDGKRHGEAKSYYKDGTLRQSINYVNNVKEGLAVTYYQNGRKYQETPYEKGKINGIRKKYRMNGNLMAEVPYINNEPCAGLVEYLLNGERKTNYPHIKIRPVDELLKKDRYSLILSISDGSKDVVFYSGKPVDEGCIPHYAIPLGSHKAGKAIVRYDLPPNAYIMEEMNFIAKVKTKLGNPYIIETSHNLAIENW
ncbi:toxin-antitoxin system YwqK family antitoxin [Fulvivirga sp. RKSG066]|uniref:toxin-antitoxin system YwqK family antitoxin n=1 Tax=Fulvivirga aurantia TaxID=2529383 RepID=UPI0012BC3438|nr:toxin-antitoxin system YwqK family antitoxin [Fulvivirga aurantia]MTI23301.1 toxin-antitoxin system YwqK family antitoxin [Fulvivirga aurantia]